MFDEKTEKVAYNKQTQAVKGKGRSNCPLCAVGDNASKAGICDFDEMDAAPPPWGPRCREEQGREVVAEELPDALITRNEA